MPNVTANAKDGSWVDGNQNALLAQMVWYVDDVSSESGKKDITLMPEWDGLYEIDTSDTEARGTIKILRNLAANEQITLHFEAVLADTRLNINHPIISEPITLTTVNKTDDAYSLSIPEDCALSYNPVHDPLLIYEHEVAIGARAYSSTDYAKAAADEKSYYIKIPFLLFKGINQIDSADYDVLLCYTYDVTHTSDDTDSDIPELVSISDGIITLDCRFIEKSDYTILVRAKGDTSGVVLCQGQFTIQREYPAFELRTINGTAIQQDDLKRQDKVIASCCGEIVEYPELYLKMVWKTDSNGATGVTHNEGSETIFEIANTGIGEDYENSWLETYVDYDYKGAHEIVTTSSGEILVDEDNNILIVN
jgi:hypothetical protein